MWNKVSKKRLGKRGKCWRWILQGRSSEMCWAKTLTRTSLWTVCIENLLWFVSSFHTITENKAKSASTHLRSPSDCRTRRVSSWKPANKRVCITPVVTWALMLKRCHDKMCQSIQIISRQIEIRCSNNFFFIYVRTSWNSLKPQSRQKSSKHSCSSQHPVTMLATVAKANSWLSSTALCFLLCRSCKSTGNCRGKKDQILHDVEDDAPREGAVQTLDGD